MSVWEPATKIAELPVEAKVAVILRLAECIEGSKDPDVQSGLKALFKGLVHDMSLLKEEARH